MSNSMLTLGLKTGSKMIDNYGSKRINKIIRSANSFGTIIIFLTQKYRMLEKYGENKGQV